LHVQGSNLHDFINQCLAGIGLAQGELKALVGPDEAARLIIGQLDSPNKTDELKQEGDNK